MTIRHAYELIDPVQFSLNFSLWVFPNQSYWTAKLDWRNLSKKQQKRKYRWYCFRSSS
jgi:hypothetical protein